MRCLALLPVYALALAAGCYLCYQPTIDSSLARWQADPGDTVLNHYLLEHTFRAMFDSGYKPSLLSPPFFHPAPLVLGYSETLLGTAPLYWGLRIVLPPHQAYPVWMIALHGLNFVAFAMVGRWLKLPHVLNLLGSFLFAFAVCYQFQIGHQQLIPRFWMPFAAYFLFEFVTAPNANALRKCLIVLGLQMTACINSGVMLGDGLVIFAIVALTFRRGGWREAWSSLKADKRGYARAFAIGGAIWLLAIAPQIAANIGGGHVRGYDETIEFMPKVTSWVTPPPRWRWQEKFGGLQKTVCDECYLFSGAGFYVLLLASLAPGLVCRREQQAAWLAGSCGISAVLLALSVVDWGDGVSAWWFVRFLPGGLAVRAIGRMYLAVYLFTTLGGCLGIAALLREYRIHPLLALVLAVPMVWEQTGYQAVSFETASVEVRIDPVADLMRGSDVAYLQATTDLRWDVHGQLLAMWAGHRAGVPVINGYTGRWPTDYKTEADWTDDDLKKWLGPGFHGRIAIINPTKLTVRHLDVP